LTFPPSEIYLLFHIPERSITAPPLEHQPSNSQYKRLHSPSCFGIASAAET
jgi:hypothetical protein